MITHYVVNRLVANDYFMEIFWQARKDTFFSRIFGSSSRLKSLDEVWNNHKKSQRRYLGVMEFIDAKVWGIFPEPNTINAPRISVGGETNLTLLPDFDGLMPEAADCCVAAGS
ncbi:MAG: hypothetical protein DWQ04_20090 [Chloroflexi bacterium]|nr:MAG: hypothetical protein DWQ04_20090 [Chloroflexota bacterium]